MVYAGSLTTIWLSAAAGGGNAFFDQVTATSTDAFVDFVTFYDSPGNDTYEGRAGVAGVADASRTFGVRVTTTWLMASATRMSEPALAPAAWIRPR